MLADKDRIFTNLYGSHDWGLEGAKARGAWDGTKAHPRKRPDWIIDEVRRRACAAAAAPDFRPG